MQLYRLTPEAEADLLKIWLHVAEDNEEAADRVLNALNEAFAKLAQLPGMSHRRQDLTMEALRFWPVYSYLIVYRPETDPLEIVRVVSGFRDLSALLIGH